MQTQEFEDVLSFWFPELRAADHARMVRQFEWWFRGGADSAISERFSLLLERATRGELDGLSGHARGWHSSLFWISSLAPFIGTRRERSHKIRKPSGSRLKELRSVTLRLSRLLGRRPSSSSHWGISSSSRTYSVQSHLPSSSRPVHRRNCARF